MPLQLETLRQAPIEMIFCPAPGAGIEAQQIWDKGTASFGVNVMDGPLPQITPDNTAIDLQTATRHSFGFVGMWGRKGGDSKVVACLSTSLLGFDGTDPKRQQECGLDILGRIAGVDTKVTNYGDHKYVAFLETDLDPAEMVKRVLEAEATFIGSYFPRVREAQQELTQMRQAELIDLPDRQPFVEIFDGEVSTLKRAWEPNGNHYFEWGYQEEDGDLYAINPDNSKQSLSSLIEGSPLGETSKMLTDIGDFITGERGKNRFVIQLDFGEDAACSNVAINAQQDIASPLNLLPEDVDTTENSESSLLSISSIRHASGGGGNYETHSFDYCGTCKMSKSENKCMCGKNTTSD